MLCGRYPFDTKDSAYLRKVLQAEYAIPSDLNISAACRDLMSRLMVPNPEERLTMEGIKTHPWFLADLPPGAMEMNEMLLHDPATMAEYDCTISNIVDEAVAVGGAASRPLYNQSHLQGGVHAQRASPQMQQPQQQGMGGAEYHHAPNMHQWIGTG